MFNSIPMKKCNFCAANNPEDIKICLNCGRNLNSLGVDVLDGYQLDFSDQDTLENQIRESFFKKLRYQVENELDTKAYRKYFDHFHASGFYKKFNIRSNQLAEEFMEIHEEQAFESIADIFQKLDQTLNEFVNFFIIVHCQPLHKMALPSAILRYETIVEKDLDLKKMIFDFLDFGREKDKVYDNFSVVPDNKLKNAKEAFLFIEDDEDLFFICDQTIFGSCKEGFAMTDKCLYWKAHFNEASKVAFKDLRNIEKEGEWIVVNGNFFNVNKTMNYKMMKLLQKLQSLNGQ